MHMSERDAFAILDIKTLTVSPPLLEKAYDQALRHFIRAHNPQESGLIQQIYRAYQVLSEGDTKKKSRIYVVCLASYHQGQMHGLWIDPMQTPALMEAQIAQMISESPSPDAKDWEIHHTEGFGYKGIFHDDLEMIHQKARFILEHGRLGVELLNRYNDPQRAHYIWDEHYHGIYESKADFAFKFCSEYDQHPLMKHLEKYIDYQDLGTNLFAEDYFFIELDNRLHVFREI